MYQENIFKIKEGNEWFSRNKTVLMDEKRYDWPLKVIEMISEKNKINTVLEVGCSNGWRLSRLQELFCHKIELYGIDASKEAIEDGQDRYSGINLKQGLLSQIPYDEKFDLVIINFVFHWLDRSILSQSISEIDRVTKNKGFVIVGDFLPNFPQKRSYHHLPKEKVFTYKQDYVKIFKSLGTYSEMYRVCYDHSNQNENIDECEPQDRAHCSLVQKNFDNYYLLT